MTNRQKHKRPHNQILLQENQAAKSTGPILAVLESLLAVFVFLIYCAIMYHVVN